MTQFTNSPALKSNEHNEGMVKRYVHQPLTIEHFGIHAQIKENGKVSIKSNVVQNGDVVEYDEVEIPASLVFKLASLLKATRTIKFVPVGEARDLAPVIRDID